MDASLKKILKSVTLELRHLLEGRYDTAGNWKPGDLEERLAAIGVRRDKQSVPVDELDYLSEEDKHARKVVDAYIQLREEAGVSRTEAVAEFVRETASTWANRLLALRCMESRDLIDQVILKKEVYGGRSLEHHRLAQRQPELCAGEDDGMFAVLDKVFAEHTKQLPMLFDPQAPGVALRPSAPTLQSCIELLSVPSSSLKKADVRTGQASSSTSDPSDSQSASIDVYKGPDALGWAYQFWNNEEKARVFEKVRTVKNAKIAGADIVPATQLYTEDYMVKFLVQNSLGATWMGMYPESKLCDGWDYYVRDADRAPVEKKPVREITFLDPACGSGHFLIEAFDLFFAMYEEEGELTDPEEICTAILTQNLFGIDIDARAVQIAEATLWMKAAERVFDYDGAAANLVAATASHLKGPAWEEFVAGFTREPSVARVLRKFAETMEHIDEVGSLARPAEDLRAIIEEEHVTWEKQQRELRQAGDILFQEMREDAVRGQLPFLEISDGEFGDELFYRAKVGIDGFTEQARESGAFDDQMLANETRAGFRLLDLLSRQYDVVTANPPYMGSGNMSAVLKEHVAAHFVSGKNDLFAAFILRTKSLLLSEGRFSFVVPQLWMALKSYADFRAAKSDDDESTFDSGILVEHSIENLVQLGRHAFSEVDPPANVTMLCASAARPAQSHRLWAARLSSPRPASEQARLLLNACKETDLSFVFRPHQSAFLSIPGTAVAFWLRDKFLSLFNSITLEKKAVLAEPTTTGNNPRFFRAFWEVRPNGDRWRWAARGGGYARWIGFQHWMLDWEYNGIRIKSSRSSTIRNESLMFRSGLTYTESGRGSLGVRLLGENETFAKSGPGILVSNGDRTSMAAVLNCRLSSYLLRTLARGFMFSLGNLAKTPIIENESGLNELSNLALSLKRRLVQTDPTEREFDPKQLFAFTSVGTQLRDEFRVSAALLIVEGKLESEVCSACDLSEDDLKQLTEETGVPVAWYPQMRGGSSVKSIVQEDIAAMLGDYDLETAQHNSFLDPEAIDIRRAQAAFEECEILKSDSTDDADDDMEVEEADLIGSIPLRCDTLFEGICNRLQLHPSTVLELVGERVSDKSWRNRDQEFRVGADASSGLVLQLLGYRWPSQIAARELMPDWADPDGIIPLTPFAGQATLIERIHDWLSARKINICEFSEVLPKPLDAWLTTEFFAHHTKQFKKRPIAWQVQSGSFTARSTPAIACLLYYHKLDGDLLCKVRKLAEDLRKSRETELRSIQSVAPEARSDRQEKRRVELDDAVVELQRFDTMLETVSTAGFGPDSLRPALRQYAINDAFLTLKCRWLRRLSDLIAKGPLGDWLKAASKTELHPDFGLWIENAISHLDYFCARVGPQPSEQQMLAADPTATDLAKLISAECRSIFTSALRLACDVWWKQFDEAVLQPIKAQVKELKEEQKQCDARLKADPEPEPMETRELKARVKELKAEIKTRNTEITKRSGRAQAVRDPIEAWRSGEPETWGDWLAEQPLFDQISSLDDRRPAPKTIAEFIAQESLYAPDLNDGVRVNIAPLQKAGILAADVLAAKDVDKAIADRAEWRADERRWVREGKLPQPGWWPEKGAK